MLRKLGVKRKNDGDNPISLLLPNGSRIVGVPGNAETVRGFAGVSLLLVDEAARVKDEMFVALEPMPAVGEGDLWLMSTPNGPRGFFYEVWSGGGEEWMRVSVPATECERISADFLEEERGAMTATMFGQEYLCEFTGDGTELFSRELLEAAIDLSIPELKIEGWR